MTALPDDDPDRPPDAPFALVSPPSATGEVATPAGEPAALAPWAEPPSAGVSFGQEEADDLEIALVEPAGAGERKPVWVAVEVGAAALLEIRAHACSHPDREVGGLLLGQVHEEPEARFRVEITAGLRARYAAERTARLTFTHETWDSMIAERESRFPELKVVGWYHTHPGFGIFLSEHDKFIHRHFFPDPTHVAVVWDPHADRMGVFCWYGAAIIRADDVSIVAHRATPPEMEALRRHLSPAEY